MKIAIVTCYDQQDYARARSLRSAFAKVPGIETQIIRNRHRGWLRYLEVPLRITGARLWQRPDAYVVTFRGYEMLLFMVLTLAKKPIVFDELINFTEWMQEHDMIKPPSLIYRLFRRWNAWVVSHCRFVLADTDAHAQYSAQLNHLPQSRYCVIPVSADETVFKPLATNKHDDFTVLYYGSMLKLHGLPLVLEAATSLKHKKQIKFRIIGGKRSVVAACQQAAAAGANVTHQTWLDFNDLPKAIAESDLILGGPFANTLQAQYVITGKTAQALAMAKPVLIGSNQASQKIFEDRVNCLETDLGNAAALALSIDWASQHLGELETIGQNGRQLYERHFSEAVLEKKITDLVRELNPGAKIA